MTAAERRAITAGTIAAATLGATAGTSTNWLANLATGLTPAAITGLLTWVVLTATAALIKAAR